MHEPRAEHVAFGELPIGHAGRSHELPLQPLLHWHRPLYPQVPCVIPPHSLPERSLGHARVVQSKPFQPSWHSQRPSGRQVPRLEHFSGHAGISHLLPAHPGAHTQTA